MIRVQMIDGQWATLADPSTAPAELLGAPVVAVVPPAGQRKREWVNTAHVVRIIETDGDA